jgi:hypothetical protein
MAVCAAMMSAEFPMNLIMNTNSVLLVFDGKTEDFENSHLDCGIFETGFGLCDEICGSGK